MKIATLTMAALALLSAACPPPDVGDCDIYPPGVCWCGPGCGDVPPGAECEPMPIEACSEVE